MCLGLSAADVERRMQMCGTILLFAVVFGLPFTAADLAQASIQHPTTQNPIPTRTLAPGLSESPIPRYDAYASRVTAPPVINPQQLFGRETVATTDDRFCAYANGDGASPIYCPNDYTCTYLGPFSTAWGCCNPRTCINAPRTCFGQNDPSNFCTPGTGPFTIDCNSIYTSLLTCTGNNPKCATYIIKTNTLDPQDTGGPESWSCATSATQIFVFFTPISNAGAEITYTDSPSATVTRSPNSQNTTNSDNSNNNKKSSLDTGAIIGIIVAVLGVLATVLVGLFPRQMTRFLTCGLRPKKLQSNDEIRKNFWLYISGRGDANGPSQLHIHYHNTPTDQQALAQAAAPIGLSPITSPGGNHQGYWPQQQQGQQGQWGYNTGYEQHPPPPAYQQQQMYGHPGGFNASGQYAGPGMFELHDHEQRQPFLEIGDTGKNKR